MHDPEFGRMMLALRSPRKEGRGMRVVEASAIVPLSPEDVGLAHRRKMHQLVEMPDFGGCCSRTSRFGPTERPATS